mmetsp:Transcript_11337/g.23939  ORF Transcript_11337/g.23939 Transcript_11337/m.23939 type:complete len:88 (-) Transcript_11337:168-431(-)
MRQNSLWQEAFKLAKPHITGIGTTLTLKEFDACLMHGTLHRKRQVHTELMMVVKESPLREAPPTRKPSMLGCCPRSAAFLSFTEPPY